ncbi:hypothetical protein BCR44DRAFT_1490018 [Catenaria anguillulae PL171]|uniref:G-protein coupled receptors family 2 profile 2 domain-containing protein n=1 Tax=Catenaria anguillulae PL171 TaxID=765915 RepID=A0A1Y2H4Q8_9FUNG|nr:hypothetical protein BCR44DRAFT_1490018 [Catenaria anguillulae PL171]
MITYGFLSLSMWAGCMAIVVYLAVVRKHSLVSIAERQWIVHLLAWGVPLLAINVPYVASRVSSRKEQFYGDAGLWCWVSEPWQEYRMILFYIPIWVVFFVTIIVYGLVIAEVNDAFKPEENVHMCFTLAETQCQRAAKLRLARRTAIHLLAYFFTYFAAFMNRFVIMETGRAFFGLFVIHGMSVGSVGIMWATAHFGDGILHRVYVARARKVAGAQQRGFVQ